MNIRKRKILENDTSRKSLPVKTVKWQNDLEIIGELYPPDDWDCLSDYKWNWDRREFEEERLFLKMEIDDWINDIIATFIY